MKLPLALLLPLVIFVAACSGSDKDSDSGGGNTFSRDPQPNDVNIVIEATMIDTATDATASAWFTQTYLPAFAGTPGLVQTRHYTNLGGPPPFPWPGGPTELTFFHFSDAASRDGFSTSAAATAAPTNPAVTQLSRSYYTLTTSSDNGGSSGNLPNLTVIGLVVDPALDAQIVDWEDNTHVPMLMGYAGLAKVVRYTKVAGGTNDTDLPNYLEFFYYRDQAAVDGWQASSQFMTAEADRAARWTDAQLAINPIVAAVIGYAMP